LLARKRAGQVNKLNLKTRPYLGPTSLVPELGLLMANQAKVQPGHLVLDPFVGTGGIAIPATELGGFVLGGDIDIRVLKGKQGRNLGTCYKEYGLGIPELVRMDNHMR
jgi:tRNA (guanine10-N2)-methyltransferase